MTRDAAQQTLRTLARLAGVTLLSLAAAYAGLIVLAAARTIWLHVPLGMDVLRQNPTDSDNIRWLAVYGGFLVLELIIRGREGNALRRLLLGRHPSDRADLFYVIADATGLSSMLTVLLSCGLGVALQAVLDAGDFGAAANLPFWVAVLLIYVGGDFVEYWGHRFMHSRLMWPLHAIHHAAEDMTVLSTSRHHPLDNFFGELWFVLPAGLLGFSPDAMAVTMLVMSAHVTLLHSKLPFPAWLERYIAGPRAHRIHHAIDPACHDSNFAALTIWDRMFGTFRMMDVTGLATGLADRRYETGHPLRDMFEATRIWLVGLGNEMANRKLKFAERLHVSATGVARR